MLPIEIFIKPEPGSRPHNAIRAAVKERPTVTQTAAGDHIRYFSVRRKKKDGYSVYDVKFQEDRDGQGFIECACVAGSPPIDRSTGLPQWEPIPCVHAAAVLMHMSGANE